MNGTAAKVSGFVWAPGTPQRIPVGGVGCEAVCHGPAPQDAPTFVLLHEGLGCVELWRDFPLRLAEATGFGVFAWSRGGYGRSDPVPLPRPLDYMSREAHGALPGILDAIGCRRAILLGHSDGASIAALYAGTAEDRRVERLILMAPHFFTESAGLASIAEARKAYDAGDLRGKLAKYHAHVDVAFRGWNDAWLDARFASWNIADCLDGLSAPSLVIQGADDVYGTALQVDAVVNRSPAPVRVAMLAGCGHAPHLEAPAQTLAAIVEFCGGLL